MTDAPGLGRAHRGVGQMIAISWRSDQIRSIAAAVTATGQYVVLPLRALGIAVLVDGVVAGDRSRAALGAAVAVGLSAVNRLMAWASLNVRMRLREHTQLYLDTHLMALTAGIPTVTHHELPEYLDAVQRLREERYYLANPFNPLSWTTASVLQAATVVVLLARVSPLVAVLPFLALPAAIAAARSEQRGIALRDQQAEATRVQRHVYHLATDPEPAKEIRIYGLGDELLARRASTFAQLDGARLAHSRAAVPVVAGCWVVFAAGYAAALWTTVTAAAAGRMTLGDVVLVLTLGAQLNAQLAELAGNVAWFSRSLRAVRRLVWFSDYAAAAHAAVARDHAAIPPETLRDGLHLDGVGFTYPGASRPVLHDVDLHLPAGATVAIVGENGSGKTTLVKLLARLYEPTAGRILADGLDIADLDIEAWRARLSAGFQDFARFELVARRSIGAGDVARATTDPELVEALERAVAADVLDRLPDGLDTQLGRQFGGAELSGGQWQKVALGRAMLRPAPLLLVLDEPTASLDAPTEHALFERFAVAAGDVARRTGGITVLISHRFSTVRMADLIVVMGDGRIRETGSHEALMAAGGAYAELYALQAKAYRAG